MEKKTNAIIPCQLNHSFVVPNWTKIAYDLICTIPFVSSSGKQEKLKRYAAINVSSINNLIKKTPQLRVKHAVITMTIKYQTVFVTVFIGLNTFVRK